MRDRKAHIRFGVMLLLLLALTVRGAIPVGFMPQVDKSGLTRLVICTASGPSSILVDADKFGPPASKAGHSQSRPSDSCPFAPLPTLAANLLLPFAVVMEYGVQPPFSHGASLAASSIHKPWLSQGPPFA